MSRLVWLRDRSSGGAQRARHPGYHARREPRPAEVRDCMEHGAIPLAISWKTFLRRARAVGLSLVCRDAACPSAPYAGWQ